MTAIAEFAVLGPLRAQRAGRPLRIGGPRERAVLARLVLDANRVVSVDRLIDSVWDGLPPQSARAQIAICVSRLRRALRDSEFGDSGDQIVTAPPGYQLRIDEDGSDLARFAALVADARGAASAGDRPGAVTLLRSATGLWRGTPFEDLPGLRSDAARLEEARLEAIETCAELELDLGNHHRVIKDLATVVAEHPLRESVRAQLMLAQYRAGRRADSLRTYQDARRQLVEQVGLEPGPELRRLHDQILRDAPGLIRRVSVPTVVPAQLPNQPVPFVGRDIELAGLDAALGSALGSAAVPVVLAGPPEVGKTAIGLRWAHQRADRFPDGQLYADLEDGDVAPSSVLDRFLRGLGVESVPDSFGEKVALYRSTVARRTVLVFLDNAGDSAQVLPLLPAGPGSRVIITGRDALDELVARQGAGRHFVAPLAADDSRALLGMLLGSEWLSADPSEVSRITVLSGGFPLAIRLAAARLASATYRSRRPLHLNPTATVA